MLIVDRLRLDYSHLTSDVSPAIEATLNSLCAEPLDQFFVTVLFGTKEKGKEDCVFTDSKTAHFTDSRIISISLDTNAVTIPTHQAANYEYCARGGLNDLAFTGKSVKTHNTIT